jgi:hypothetical protein
MASTAEEGKGDSIEKAGRGEGGRAVEESVAVFAGEEAEEPKRAERKGLELFEEEAVGEYVRSGMGRWFRSSVNV